VSETLLRTAIAAFSEMWRDPDGERPGELLDPASPAAIAEIESLLGAPLPAPVRIVLETFDGSFLRVSPMRPDIVLSAFEITLKLSEARDVVPLIECGLDPETGLSRLLGVSVADPWGNLSGSSMTLTGWFEQITTDLKTYEWPDPKKIVVDLEWSQHAAISESVLVALPVGAAVAIVQPTARRNRIKLHLFVQLEPGVWARGIHRQGDHDLPLHAICASASTDIEREIARDRSQWALAAADVVSAASAKGRELFEGTVQIETVSRS
jgi:hypothetical protein